MDNTKLAQHEITAAKMWREVGNVERALQHLEYALAYLQDDKAAQPSVQADETFPHEKLQVLHNKIRQNQKALRKAFRH